MHEIADISPRTLKSAIPLANDPSPHVIARLGAGINELDLDARLRLVERYHDLPEADRRAIWEGLAKLNIEALPIEGRPGEYRIGLKIALPSIQEIAKAFLS